VKLSQLTIDVPDSVVRERLQVEETAAHDLYVALRTVCNVDRACLAATAIDFRGELLGQISFGELERTPAREWQEMARANRARCFARYAGVRRAADELGDITVNEAR
jgi:hypothetical protein